MSVYKKKLYKMLIEFEEFLTYLRGAKSKICKEICTLVKSCGIFE